MSAKEAFLLALVFTVSFSATDALPFDEPSGPEDRMFLDFFAEFAHQKNELLEYVSSSYPLLADKIKQLITHRTVRPQATFSCDGCEVFIDAIREALSEGLNYTSMRPAVIALCEVIVNGSGKHGHIICPGLMDNYAPHVEYIIKTKNIPGRDFCLKLQICMPDQLTTPASDVMAQTEWSQFYPAEVADNQQTKNSKSVLRIAHLTDIHVDLDYLEGTVTDCGLMVCCRKDIPGKGQARRYGDKGCNIPPRTVQSVLNFIKTIRPPVNYVIYTGDNCRGSMYEETQGLQLNQTEWMAKQFAAVLSPGLRVFPVIGNHESFPTNLYHIQRPEIQELNNKWADWWKEAAKFDQEMLKTIKYAGYYTALPQKGLRILAYNSNYGYSMNFYNLFNENGKDYKDMLAFMEKTLSDARKNKEKVIMVGHHPTGESESLVWYSRRISRFIIEYSDIVVLHVFGHTHEDKYKLVLDPRNNHAKGVQFVSSSLTTNRNPSFRVYDMDATSFQLNDFHNYFIDIEKTKASGNNSAPIELMYSARKEYGLRSGTPASWHDLALGMTKNNQLFDKYFDNMFARNGPSECKGDCRKGHLCDIFHSNYDSNYACKLSVNGVYPQPRGNAPSTSSCGSLLAVTLAAYFIKLLIYSY